MIMNIKTILVFFIWGVTLMLLPSCSGNDSPDEPKQLKLSETSLEYPSSGGQFKIDVKTNTQWTASGVPEWVKLSSTSGNGNATLTITASPNTDYSSRSADIKFKGVNSTEQLTASLHIQQALSEAVIVDGSSASVGWEGGTLEIPYKYTSVPAITIDGNPDWVKIKPSSRALTEDKIIVTIEKNNGDERTATINFQLEDKTEQFVVKQEAYIPVQSISFNQVSPFNITTNGTYTLEPIIYPDNSSNKTVRLSSSNQEVVTISEDGVLTVVSNGDAVIKATAEADGISAELQVVVKIKAQSISMVEWYEGNGIIPAGWSEVCKIYGSWGYEYTPQFKVEPENAYIGDMEMLSSNNMLVAVNGNKLVCNNDNRSGHAEITVNLPYSGVSTKVTMEVKGYYIVAGLGTMEQDDNNFFIDFTGYVYTNNPTDEFTIEGLSIVDENNQVITYGFNQSGNGTNKVKWESNRINLADYGITLIDSEFYDRISKWKAVITFSSPKYHGQISESINIDPHNQY